MTYSRLKLEDILERFGVQRNNNSSLFLDTPPHAVSEHLKNTLRLNLELALNIGTEKARSELLIMPVFAELYQQASDHISLFSGVALNVDKEKGLAGEVDFLLSRSSVRSIVTAPIVAVAEAKRDDFTKGAAQCIGEMIASRIFNQRHNHEMPVFGVITNGTVWQFARFAREDLVEVSGDFTLQDPAKIMGILWLMIAIKTG